MELGIWHLRHRWDSVFSKKIAKNRLDTAENDFRKGPRSRLSGGPAGDILKARAAFSCARIETETFKVVRSTPGNKPAAAGDIGTTKPLGVFDPLQLMNKMPDKYRRWQEMEIKHGRFAMAACLHVFVTEARDPAERRAAPYSYIVCFQLTCCVYSLESDVYFELAILLHLSDSAVENI